MDNEQKGCKGCVIGMIETIGLIIALSWPILLLFQWAADHKP